MKLYLVLTSLVFAACTSSSSSDDGAPKVAATISGSIGGAQPVAIDAIAFNKEGNLTLKLTDYAGACELEEMNNAHKQGSHYLELYLGAYPGQTGTFVVDETDATHATYFSRDATCSGDSAGANSGSIVIGAITAERVTGTFDLVFGATDHVTGTFTAGVCGDGMVVGTGGACVP